MKRQRKWLVPWYADAGNGQSDLTWPMFGVAFRG